MDKKEFGLKWRQKFIADRKTRIVNLGNQIHVSDELLGVSCDHTGGNRKMSREKGGEDVEPEEKPWLAFAS
jgi:hypothetical protein